MFPLACTLSLSLSQDLSPLDYSEFEEAYLFEINVNFEIYLTCNGNILSQVILPAGVLVAIKWD